MISSVENGGEMIESSGHYQRNVSPQGSAQFVVVHILLGFLVSPLSGNLVGVQQTKFTLDWES